ncbi:hypothetical protein CL689_02965 [Candidatus Saccharibacteria bacterium]|nr:hypothetical protein [Candidatus Saccharibacteria bacterium]
MSLEQIKKQAKRLHKILPEVLPEVVSQRKDFNLAICQEIVAKQYRYPSFHAATQSVSENVSFSPSGAPVRLGSTLLASPGPLVDETALSNVCKKVVKILDAYPMIGETDRREYHGGIGFFEVAAKKSFDVYAAWVGTKRGVDEYSLLVIPSSSDASLFEAGAFLNNDAFRSFFLRRIEAEIDLHSDFSSMKFVSVCGLFGRSDRTEEHSLHLFPFNEVDDFDLSVEWHCPRNPDPVLRDAPIHVLHAARSQTVPCFSAQHILIYLHWVLERVSVESEKSWVVQNLYNHKLLNVGRLVDALSTCAYAASRRGDHHDMGVEFTLPPEEKSPLVRFLESYSTAVAGGTSLIKADRSRGTSHLSGEYQYFVGATPLSGVKSLLKGFRRKPLNFGAAPLLVFCTRSFTPAAGLIASFVSASRDQGRRILYLARSAEVFLPEHLRDAVDFVDLGILEQSPEEVNTRLKFAFFKSLQYRRLSLVIEDCDHLSTHPALNSFLNQIKDQNIPALLLSQGESYSDQSRLFSLLGKRETAVMFSMADGSRSAAWFNQSLGLGDGLEASKFREDYSQGDLLIYKRLQGNPTKGDWFELNQ